MDAMKLRKNLSKPGLLQVVRSCFDQVVDPVDGWKFVTGECLMVGLAGVSGEACVAATVRAVDAGGLAGFQSAPAVRVEAGFLRHDYAPRPADYT